MTTYTMEAKENYPADIAAYVDANDAFENYITSEQVLLGLSYDPVRRKLFWPAVIWDGLTEVITNTTGFTLWDGETAMAPGDPLDQATDHTLYLFEKDIDTGAIVSYFTWDAAQLVPAGVGGGDGTWRRRVFDIDAVKNYPTLVDPRTGNAWLHTQSCELHCFTRALDYAISISPIFPVSNENAPVLPVGMSEDWVFAFEEFSAPGPNADKIYVTPRIITAAEVTADYLLIYAAYDLPFNQDAYVYRMAVDRAGFLWMFGIAATGSNPFKLWKLTPPTLGAYPATGGGWTDETPWTSDGPNTDTTAYIGRGNDSVNRNLLFATGDEALTLLSQLYPTEVVGGVQVDYRMDCTYLDTGDLSYVTHSGIVTGYMKADWTTAADVDEAAYAINVDMPTFEVNTYLDRHDYDFSSDVPGLDYRDRWIWFVCFPVVEGVTGTDPRVVMVKYRFDPGAEPVVLKVLDEQGWDDAYPAYGAAVSVDQVVYASLDTAQASPGLSFKLGRDKAIHDPVTNAFWLSGKNDNVWALDAAFTDRAAADPDTCIPTPPLMRLTFTEPVPRRVSVSSYVGGPT